SMGGNLVLKMAGEADERGLSPLRGVCAVCPSLELEPCVKRMEAPRNFFYQWFFVSGLRRRLLRKAALYSQIYSPKELEGVRSIRSFDDRITAPHSGYRDAADYYYRASAARVADKITAPTLVLFAQDDPLVPPEIFRIAPLVGNSHITIHAEAHGGHCSFISGDPAERHWAEARVVEFCAGRSELLARRQLP
ncbi:MAG: YheT family hydrolase, partial [Bryobacteraceae bacterium]